MGRKDRRSGASRRHVAIGTSDGSRLQQPQLPKETSFIINDDGDMTIKVHRHDPFNAQNITTEIQNFKVKKDLLVSASSVFKAMLTHQEFAEAGSSSVALHEDAGITCRAMRSVLRGLDLHHQSSIWTPEQELLRRRPDHGVVYSITPLHILELMWYTYRDCNGRPRRLNSRSRHGRQIESNKLQWWLDHYSELSGKVARMTPYQQLAIKSEEVASVSRRMKWFFWGEGGFYPHSAPKLKKIAALERNLFVSEGLSEHNDQQVGTDSQPPVHGHSLPEPQAGTFINDEQLVLTTRHRLAECAYNLELSSNIGENDNEALQDLKKALIKTRNYETDNHPNPSTYFVLQFDQIRQILERASGTRVIDLTDWGVTKYLWKNEYMYERSQPVPVNRDAPGYDWAYNISIEELPRILLALDKYRIPPTHLSEWFSIWYTRKFLDIEKKVDERPAKVMVPKLMTLLLASYHFDNARCFTKTAYQLELLRTSRAAYSWKPLFPRLIEKFPALKDVVTLDVRILQCLNRESEWIPLCLDCFKASIYPFDGTSEVPDSLKAWAQRNLETLARKKARKDEPEFSDEEDDESLEYRVYDGFYNGFYDEFDYGLYSDFNDEFADDCFCRVDHGADTWERSWARTPDLPRPKWDVYEQKIKDEAIKLGLGIMEHVRRL